jgi:hypothetical protein
MTTNRNARTIFPKYRLSLCGTRSICCLLHREDGRRIANRIRRLR